MRIAIVGGGVSGLVSAHLLARQHEIVLFEAGAHAGGHTNTVRVDTADETHQIDNDRNYPNFERLLDRLRVAWQPSDMSFSVADEHGAFEYNGASPNGVFATRAMLREVWFHRMLAEIPRFQRAAKALLASSEDGPSLGGWLEAQRFSRPFIDRLIVPQAAAVWSADPRQMWSFPARLLVEFFDNHGMLTLRGRPRWRVVRGGSARYVEALTRPFADRIRLGARVSEIRRGEDHVTVRAEGQQAERFDHVVIASHSDEALAMLIDASQREREILAAIPYQRNEAVLHTDVALLPRRRRAWASWNYHLLDEPQPRATVTYHMNRLQSLSSRHQFLVTLNRSEAIDPARVIQSFDYSHPVFTPAGITAQRRIEEISGRNRTHYCGAYWGFGFHEDGVRSAIRVAAGLGVST
jgi:predicted NAD/FAD-binding protein